MVQVERGPDQRRRFRYLVQQSRVFHAKEVLYQEERNWEAIVVGIDVEVSYRKEWDLKAESAEIA